MDFLGIEAVKPKKYELLEKLGVYCIVQLYHNDSDTEKHSPEPKIATPIRKTRSNSYSDDKTKSSDESILAKTIRDYDVIEQSELKQQTPSITVSPPSPMFKSETNLQTSFRFGSETRLNRAISDCGRGNYQDYNKALPIVKDANSYLAQDDEVSTLEQSGGSSQVFSEQESIPTVRTGVARRRGEGFQYPNSTHL